MNAPDRSKLLTIGRAFEADRARYPDLLHFLVAAREDHREMLTSVPWHDSSVGVHVGTGVRPVPGVHGGTLRGLSFSPGDGGTGLDRVTRYQAGYFGCDDQLQTSRLAIEAFQRLAERAWEALPEIDRMKLSVDGWVDLSADITAPGWKNWIIVLYAIAWKEWANSGLSAPRQLFRRDGNRIFITDLEYWARLPDPVDHGLGKPIPKSQYISEHFLKETLLPWGGPGTPADMSLSYPPAFYAAFLEPDLFLASKLAIDALLGGSILAAGEGKASSGSDAGLPAGFSMLTAEPNLREGERQRLHQEEFEEEQYALSLIRDKTEVCPGKLMTNLPDSFNLHPLDDEDFDPALHVLMGVSLWGPLENFQPGLARVATPKGDRFALIRGYQRDRPSCGVPILDAWIMRAHVARSQVALRSDQRDLTLLSHSQWRAATIGVVHVLRSSAMALVNKSPTAPHSARVILARVADATKPTKELLDSAIAELYVAASSWPTSVRNGEGQTVTQAAEQLMTVVDNLKLKHARARVSAAANRGAFKTNGKKGEARRIDRDSFSTWILAQQKANLDRLG